MKRKRLSVKVYAGQRISSEGMSEFKKCEFYPWKS